MEEVGTVLREVEVAFSDKTPYILNNININTAICLQACSAKVQVINLRRDLSSYHPLPSNKPPLSRSHFQ